jgi:hypothetical protein
MRTIIACSGTEMKVVRVTTSGTVRVTKSKVIRVTTLWICPVGFEANFSLPFIFENFITM